MQLLHCRPIPTAEFASLSLLLKNDSSSEERTTKMGDCMTVACPLTTLPLSCAASCIRELHEYVNSVYEISPSNTARPSPSKNTKTKELVAQQQLLLDDAATVLLGGNEPVHVFRCKSGHGIGLHFCVLQEKSMVQKCAAVVLDSSKIIMTSSVESVVGVILCVGVSGSPSSSSSSLAMTRRMRECLKVVEGLESFADIAECQVCIKSALSTMVLADEEEKKTNAMVEFESVAFVSGMDGDSAFNNEKIKSVVSPMVAVRKTKKNQGKRRSSAFKGDSMSMGNTSDRDDVRFVVSASPSSADVARTISDRVAVLSVAESESLLRKYEATGLQRRSSMNFSLGKPKVRVRRRKSGNEADLQDFDCPALPNSIKKQSVPALRPPGLDTTSMSQNNPAHSNTKPTHVSPKKVALPTILAPRNDVATRRAGHHATKRRPNGASNARRGGHEEFALPREEARSDFAPQREAAFNAFAVESAAGNQPFENGTFPPHQFGGLGDERDSRNAPSHTIAINGGDPWGMISAAPTTEFNSPPSDQALSTLAVSDARELPNSNSVASPPSALSPESPRRRLSMADGGKTNARESAVSKLQRMLLASEHSSLNGLHDDDVSQGDRSAMSYQRGEWIPSLTVDPDLRSAYSELDELVAKLTPAEGPERSEDREEPRLMINVALNEDLTCSYRQSKMSSCSIEGVVQVQVTCDSRDGLPFFLLLRDPSRHIKMIQENRRFADDTTQGLSSENPYDVGVDHKFTVSVPSAEDYFPILRYKCSAELRPVPIRVQTRVRVNENANCRVALQISSNPANEDDLTDLTIVMGVPPQVSGETLVTIPPGGLWNADKRSVIWCVSELGNGEKFQLQAEFEMNPDASPLPPGLKPKFPVLVRCQCMYAQLSDVELEVSDIPDVYPAVVSMKLARRFRLSHRERS